MSMSNKLITKSLQLQQQPLYKLKKHKMYREIVEDSFLSQQSSDIQASRVSKRQFSNSHQILKSFSDYLFQDLPTILLEKPVEKQNELVYGNEHNYVIFDSVVSQRDQIQQQIRLLRQNKVLTQEIKNLQNLKQQKIQALIEIKSRLKAAKIIHEADKKTNEGIDTKTKSVKQLIKSEQWIIGLGARKQSLNIVNESLDSNINSLKLGIQNFKKKKQALNVRIKDMTNKSANLREQISNKQHSHKKNLIEARIQKEKTQLSRLQQSIRKMKAILKNSNHSQDF